MGSKILFNSAHWQSKSQDAKSEIQDGPPEHQETLFSVRVTAQALTEQVMDPGLCFNLYLILSWIF